MKLIKGEPSKEEEISLNTWYYTTSVAKDHVVFKDERNDLIALIRKGEIQIIKMTESWEDCNNKGEGAVPDNEEIQTFLEACKELHKRLYGEVL